MSAVALQYRNDARAHLMRALHGDEFVLLAQEIRPLGAREHRPRCEILVRLREKDNRPVPPATFFPLLEQHGMLAALDRWIVSRALRWQGSNARSRSFRFNINLTPQTLTDQRFPHFVAEEVRRNGLDAKDLCFEISAACALSASISMRRCIAGLRRVGCALAIGSPGESSRNPRGLAIKTDFIKFDGRIICRSDAEVLDLAEIRSLRTPGGAALIAERVENPLALEVLREAGVEFAQGFAVSPPELIERLLEE